jgi:hypothetical protein
LGIWVGKLTNLDLHYAVLLYNLEIYSITVFLNSVIKKNSEIFLPGVRPNAPIVDPRLNGYTVNRS